MMAATAPPLLSAPLIVLCLLLAYPHTGRADVFVMDTNETLRDYLCDAHGVPKGFPQNTTIQLHPGAYVLEDGPMCRIENSLNLTIQGSSDLTTTIYCEGNNDTFRGFAFANMTNLRIEYITFEHCGTQVPTDLPALTYDTFTFFGPGQKAVLLFSHGLDLRLEWVIVDHSYGLGIVIVNVMRSVVLDVVAVKNTDNDQHPLCDGVAEDLSCSGSGAAFVYSDNNFTDALGENVTLIVSDSLFLNNINRAPVAYFLPLFLNVRSAFKSEPILLSGGAGLGVYSSQKDFFFDFIMYRTFVVGCTGQVGGVLLFNYNTVMRTTYYIRESHINWNLVEGSSRGAGMLLIMAIYLDHLGQFEEYPDVQYVAMTVEDSEFFMNAANEGGGLYLHITPQNISEVSVVIRNTSFIGNIANVGSAVGAAGVTTSFISKSTSIWLEDVTAFNNTFVAAIVIGRDAVADTSAFVFVNIHNITVSGTPEKGGKFHNNSPGVFIVSGGQILLRGHLTFEDNHGFNGGAISVFGSTKLFIEEGSNLYFARNSALQSGGAIYGNSLGTGIADACMLQFIGPSQNVIYTASEVHTLNLNITFVDNMAGDAGNSFFGNPIYDCIFLPESSIQHSHIFENEIPFYDAIFNFSSTVDNGIQELNSIPHRMCYCGEDTFSLDTCRNFSSIEQYIAKINTFPGKEFTINLIPVDRADYPVSSLLYAELESDAQLTFGPGQSTQSLRGSSCTAVNFSLFGNSDSKALIFLYAGSTGYPVIINVTVASCPPGFTLEPNNDGILSCLCDAYITDHVETTCNGTAYTIKRPENSWLGVRNSAPDENTMLVYVETCPINYCNEIVTDVDLLVDDQLCETGRSGILCGQCKTPLSVTFGSAKCKECSSLWLLTIPLYIIVGILIVLVLFALELTVDKGTIIGLIFYANIVSVNTNIFFRGSSQGFLFIFISFLNLELGFPLCFYDGMTDVAKTGFQFIFPAYLFFLCVAIIYLSRWSSRMQKITSSSGVAVLATLVYLSYSKLLRTVIDILSFATLKGPDGSTPIWLFDGNVQYFQGSHLLLGIVAILVLLLLIIPYSFSLTFVTLIQRLRSRWIRLKPVIDVYIASFKDKWRFWFGVRLLVLTVLCILYAALGTDNPSLSLLFQLIIVVIFAVAQAYIQPYRSLLIELLDMSLILNFVILTSATIHIVDKNYSREDLKSAVTVMLVLAFNTFLGIVSYHTFIQLRKIKAFRDKTDYLYRRVMSMLKRDQYKPEVHAWNQRNPVKERDAVHTQDIEIMETVDQTSSGDTGTGTMSNKRSTAGSDSPSVPTFTEVYLDEALDSSRPHAVTFSKFRESILEHM